MEIGATKAVQDRLKTTKIEESKGASLVFCWDTHLTENYSSPKRRTLVTLVMKTSHFVATVSDRSIKQVTDYINSQKTK